MNLGLDSHVTSGHHTVQHRDWLLNFIMKLLGWELPHMYLAYDSNYKKWH